MKKFKKYIFSYILSLIMILGLAPDCMVTLYAAECDDFTYITLQDGNIITKYNGNATSVRIPESIDDKKVIKIDDEAFKDCTSIVSIEIPDSVTGIGDSAFEGCSNLRDISIPNNVVSMGKAVFKDCVSLASIEMSNRMTSIEEYTFSGCSGLKNIAISSRVTSIGSNAFNNCASLDSIEIPNSVANIGAAAFSDCTNLRSVVLSNNISGIMSETFKNCILINNIEIPNSVTYIGENAFYNCDSLLYIALPSSVNYLNKGAFSDCNNLESVIIQNDDIITDTEQSVFSDSPNVTIYGNANSSAEEYAASCNIPFAELINVSSVGLNINRLDMKNGANSTLVATILPDDATHKEIRWASNKPDTVSVDDKGNIVALKEGIATITVSSTDGTGKSAACIVTVTEEEQNPNPNPDPNPDPDPNPTPTPNPTPEETLVTSIILNPVSIYLKKGENSIVKTLILPENAANKTVVWTSSNTGVATVDADGKITAVGFGKAFIKAAANDGSGKFASCAVIVAEETVPAPELSTKDELKSFSMEINKNSLYIKKNETSNLAVSVLPDNEENRAVSWSSSNKSVATVDANGKITAIGVGSATITAISKKFAEYNISVSCIVTVYEEKKEVVNVNEKNYINIASGNVKLKTTSAIYTGKDIKPAVTVKYGVNTLKNGTDYTVSYKNNKKVGKATVTINGKGKYTGTVSKSFDILPRKQVIKKLTAVSKGFKVKYAKRSLAEASGYQIRYCTSKVVLMRAKAITVKSCKTTKKTKKKLEPKKKYFVQVRTYKKVNGKKYYGAWSDIMYITTLK